MRKIRLNFLPFVKQNFTVSVYRRLAQAETFEDQYSYFDLPGEQGQKHKYEIVDEEREGFEKYSVPIHVCHEVVANRVHKRLMEAAEKIPSSFIRRSDNKRNKRIHFIIEEHFKGNKCIWIEPYFLKSRQTWGILTGFQFVVKPELIEKGNTLDRDILIASGSLNAKGQSNLDFYLYKHDYIKQFIQTILPDLNSSFGPLISNELFAIESFSLRPKEYCFKDGFTSSSAFHGLTKSAPLDVSTNKLFYEFIYLEEDRNYAVSLLKGLRGETHSNVFSGMTKMFKIPFGNEMIKGTPMKAFSAEEIDKKVSEIKSSETTVLPIIITAAKKNVEDERFYYTLKSKFTNSGIPCQVVTKDLIKNDNALKFSLANIGLQIFAKSGGKPWKMKPAGNEYVIIGIGQSLNIEKTENGNNVEKNITYSILTDSSGIFKDIQVLSEGLESDASYWNKLVQNITTIIKSTQSRRVALHVPFRISKHKVLEKVASALGDEVELTVLVINDMNDYFGFDYENNGLVPHEGTFIRLSKYDYLAWFEGILPSNPRITKRFGNPLLIKFWYSNRPELLDDFNYREALLQDCINLSGANWRGFKAKQLPVSIFYCQRIAEFIAKFREYHLEHIEINNLKPWFL